MFTHFPKDADSVACSGGSIVHTTGFLWMFALLGSGTAAFESWLSFKCSEGVMELGNSI